MEQIAQKQEKTMSLQQASLREDNQNHQLTAKEENLDKIMPFGSNLFNYNLLTAFPLSDAQITAYAETLIRLKPEITPSTIRLVIDLFIAGRFGFEFDYKIGIRNIIKGYDALFGFKTAIGVEDENSWQSLDRNVLFGEILLKEPHRIENMTINDVSGSDYFKPKFKGDKEIYNADSKRACYRLSNYTTSMTL